MPGPRAMEVTRIVRKGGRPLEREAAPEASSQGVGEERAPARTVSELPLARVALVALVFGRERAAALLEGLSASDAPRAKELLADFAALSSARRQARVAVEFGVRPEAAARLRALMQQAPEVLRGELFRRLPSYHRSLFPDERLAPVDAAVPEAVGAWAERLVREATR